MSGVVDKAQFLASSGKGSGEGCLPPEQLGRSAVEAGGPSNHTTAELATETSMKAHEETAKKDRCGPGAGKKHMNENS